MERTPGPAAALRRLQLTTIAPAYGIGVVLLALFASEQERNVAGFAVILAVLAGPLMLWFGALRWAGVFAWTLRLLGLGLMAFGTLMLISFSLALAPLVLMAVPVALPGVRDSAGEPVFRW